MSTVAELEQDIQDKQYLVERRDLALALYQNRDFKKLILEDWCVNECARYAQISGEPALPAENRADALGMAQAAGHLRRFLSLSVQRGNQAEREIAEARETLDEVRNEEV